MADLSTVGLVFPVAVVIGYFAGRTIGGWLGAEEGGALAGILVGVASGFYNLWKVSVRLRREDASDGPTDFERRAGGPRSGAGS
jgi:hypothetical protein